MIEYPFYLFLMTFLGSLASLFLKKASEAGGILELLNNVNFYFGGFLYLVSAILNIWLLSYIDYSVILPLTSLTYVWTMIMSYMVLKEKITKRKVAGVLFILIGAICVSM